MNSALHRIFNGYVVLFCFSSLCLVSFYIVSLLLEAYGRVRRDEVEVDLVSEQFSDIADAVPNQEWSVAVLVTSGVRVR